MTTTEQRHLFLSLDDSDSGDSGPETGPLRFAASVPPEEQSDTASSQPSAEPEPEPETRVTSEPKKRVHSRALEKKWEPLDPDTHRAFERLTTVALSRLLERYEGMPGGEAKAQEALQLVSRHWLSDKTAESFMTRLRVTKLPPAKTLKKKRKSLSATEPLSIDQMLHRKQVCETYIAAEMEQLRELEGVYNSHLVAYKQDHKHLALLRESVEREEKAMEREREVKRRKYGLTASGSAPDMVQPAPDFDPNADADVAQLLADLGAQIDESVSREAMKELFEVRRGLDDVQEALNDRLDRS